MRVLIACEYSARVREAFRSKGHEAWSCDLEPSEAGPRWHIQDDALLIARHGTPERRESWDLMIAFPPCTFLTNSNAWRWAAIEKQRQEALNFVAALMASPIPRIAIENPAGAIGTNIRKADQYIQPWWFGEPYQKTTGLWLTGLPKLVPKITQKPANLRAFVDNRPRTAGSLAGTGGVRKFKDRARTFQCIADAMADQWG